MRYSITHSFFPLLFLNILALPIFIQSTVIAELNSNTINLDIQPRVLENNSMKSSYGPIKLNYKNFLVRDNILIIAFSTSANKSSYLAIDPSSLIISQITATG